MLPGSNLAKKTPLLLICSTYKRLAYSSVIIFLSVVVLLIVGTFEYFYFHSSSFSRVTCTFTQVRRFFTFTSSATSSASRSLATYGSYRCGNSSLGNETLKFRHSCISLQQSAFQLDILKSNRKKNKNVN